MTTQYETGAQRLAREQAELAALEGTNQDPAQQDTPNQAPQEPVQVDWEKRYKDLQSHSTKQIQDLQSQIPAEDFETENEKLQRQVAELHQDLNARNVADKVLAERNKVAAVHPDFESVIPSQEFTAWIESQPAVFKESIFADVPDGDMANRVLSLFKAEHTAAQPQAAPQPDPASLAQQRGQRGTPSEVNGPKIWSMAEISKMHPNEYKANADEIDKAMAEGRIRA